MGDIPIKIKRTCLDESSENSGDKCKSISRRKDSSYCGFHVTTMAPWNTYAGSDSKIVLNLMVHTFWSVFLLVECFLQMLPV